MSFTSYREWVLKYIWRFLTTWSGFWNVELFKDRQTRRHISWSPLPAYEDSNSLPYRVRWLRNNIILMFIICFAFSFSCIESWNTLYFLIYIFFLFIPLVCLNSGKVYFPSRIIRCTVWSSELLHVICGKVALLWEVSLVHSWLLPVHCSVR